MDVSDVDYDVRQLSARVDDLARDLRALERLLTQLLEELHELRG